MVEKKYLLVLVLLLIITAGISYQVATQKYTKKLDSKIGRIALLEMSLEDVKSPQTPIQTQKPATTIERITELVSSEEINCLICHELDLTTSFHVPQTIMQIAKVEGKRRRLCVDCHGPLGPPWSANKQMTPLKDIVYNNRVGLNGIFEIPNTVPHSIHKEKMELGVVRCQTCHGEGTELVVPQPDLSRGQVLVCQNCKSHPDGGNYITIHLELAEKKCTLCHTGGIIEVHREKTKSLGQV